MGYKLLTNAPHWEQFKNNLAKAHGLGSDISWGTGPQEFPCLVTARHVPDTKRVMCAYVYPEDARRLLAACLTGEEPVEAIPVAEPVADGTRDLAAELDELRRRFEAHVAQVSDYTIHHSAHLRVLLKRGFETAFFKSTEWYEASLAEGLAYVDQLAEDRKKDLSLRTLHPPAEESDAR